MIYDVAIAGGGPAGAACATLCAEAGMRVVVLEKAVFPRDKVCGGCLNVGCWRVFEMLGVAAEIRAARHMAISRVGFFDETGRRASFPIEGEISIPRSVLDTILLRRSARAGAEVREGVAIRAIAHEGEGVWRIEAGKETVLAWRIVAADGRNSTVARLLGAAPAARRDRVGLHCHASAGRFPDIELHLLPEGYCGIAPMGEGLTNFCMVADARRLEALKGRVAERFGISPDEEWRAIAPMERAAIGPCRDGVLYIGDAARVVEPFTGEGIYYALESGALAARHIASGTTGQFPAAHALLYRRRLWVNRLARWAVTHPGAGRTLLRVLTMQPAPMGYLVRKVTAV